MDMWRREFLGVLGGVATWPMVARAQQSAMPVIGFLSLRSANDTVGTLAALREGLSKTGFVEGQNLAIELASRKVTMIDCRRWSQSWFGGRWPS
jgi:putative tryptophan/tyrosine transport system substrate-binding protein